MATATSPNQAGSLFGLPGISKPVEMLENNDQLAITPVAGSQQPVTGLIPFRNTDVVLGWDMEYTINATYAAGTTTLALSQQFPGVFFGPMKLSYQGMYSPLDVTSGFDATIFQSYRPRRKLNQIGRTMLDTSPAAWPYSPQTNRTSSSGYTTATTKFQGRYNIPGALWFDRFWPLGPDGKILSNAPLQCWVSPQFMAGTSRYVVPQLTLNGLVVSGAGTTDLFPVYGSGTQTTPASVSAISGTLGFYRYGFYQPQGAADSPVLFPWQYTRIAKRYSISGRTVADITLPLNGQILSVFVNLYDPSANTISSVNYGAPITIQDTVVTKAQLLYGAGLYRFQDRPSATQRRFFDQHQFLPPEGVLVWDMALDDQGRITNENCLNTMTTSGVTVHLEFASATSTTAYATLGVESLQYTPVP